MKKIIAREFLWFITALLVAVPLSFLFLSCIDFITAEKEMHFRGEIFILELFLFGFLINFVGIYLIRFILMAFRALARQ